MTQEETKTQAYTVNIETIANGYLLTCYYEDPSGYLYTEKYTCATRDDVCFFLQGNLKNPAH